MQADAWPTRGAAPTDDTSGAELAALERQVLDACDAAGAFVRWWGFKEIHGRVWTLLALRGAPMSQAEVARLLGVSRSLLSGTMSELATYGLVRQTSAHHRAPFEAVVDVWPIITSVLREREWMLIEQARVSLEAAALAAERLERRGTEVTWSAQRIRFLLGLTEVAQSFLRVVLHVPLPAAGPELERWMNRAGRVLRGLRSLRG
jgi:DNA-binding transcriptional regulator GbsR (MarR family)